MTSHIFKNAVLSKIEARFGAFLLTFFVIVLVSYTILSIIDFLPEPLSEETIAAREAAKVEAARQESVFEQAVAAVNGGLKPKRETSEDLKVVIPTTTESTVDADPTAEVFTKDPLPKKIIFDDLDKTIAVLNPTSNRVEDLDTALLSGVVRHPDSADFASPGNIFILGHSSYLPNVFNKNFQAFNGIQKLTWGDTIRVQSSDTEYVYRVEKVFMAKASEVVVPMTPGQARLTLATCNSFGSKDDRFVVEAVLISQTAL